MTQEEIQILINKAVEKAIMNHRHSGTDSMQVNYTELKITPEAHINNPTGGITIDSEARTAINSLIVALQNKKLIL